MRKLDLMSMITALLSCNPMFTPFQPRKNVERTTPSKKDPKDRDAGDVQRLKLAYLKREVRQLKRLKWAKAAGIQLKAI